MNWTSELPTHPGYYWLSFPDDYGESEPNMVLIEIRELDGKLGVHWFGVRSGKELRAAFPEWKNYRFSGPMEPGQS